MKNNKELVALLIRAENFASSVSIMHYKDNEDEFSLLQLEAGHLREAIYKQLKKIGVEESKGL